MKITWEESDIKPGTQYSRPGIIEVWIIGYRPELDTPKQYISASLLDGMVTGPKTKAEMAEQLTRDGYIPLSVMEKMSRG